MFIVLANKCFETEKLDLIEEICNVASICAVHCACKRGLMCGFMSGTDDEPDVFGKVIIAQIHVKTECYRYTYMENIAFNRDHVTNTHASRQKYF